jgi:uncharacterized membrane protein
MLGLKLFTISGIAASIIIASAGYYVSDYFHLRTALKISDKHISVLEHKRKRIDAVTADAEIHIYKNLDIQHDALYQIHKKGYLDSKSGANPQWMLDYQTKSLNPSSDT